MDTMVENRVQTRQEAVNDLRQKLHRTNVAMSFLPAAELSRHFGLGQTSLGDKLLSDPRLGQKIYWQLVDDEVVPDIAAIPAHSEFKIIDSVANFENACAAVDIALELHERGIMISKDDIKELARRYGDSRLKWAWGNRDIWADASQGTPSLNKANTENQSDMAESDREDASPVRKRDARRMVLDHLAQTIPDIAAWMGRYYVSQQRKTHVTPQMAIVGRVIDRLVNPARNGSDG